MTSNRFDSGEQFLEQVGGELALGDPRFVGELAQARVSRRGQSDAEVLGVPVALVRTRLQITRKPVAGGGR